MKYLKITAIVLITFFLGVCTIKAADTSSASHIAILTETFTRESICNQDGVIKAFKVLAYVVMLIKIIVPVLLVLLSTINLAKAALSDDPDIKKSVNLLITRFIIAALIFFIPTIVKTVLGMVDGYAETKEGFAQCSRCLLSIKDCNEILDEIEPNLHKNLCVDKINNCQTEECLDYITDCDDYADIIENRRNALKYTEITAETNFNCAEIIDQCNQYCENPTYESTCNTCKNNLQTGPCMQTYNNYLKLNLNGQSYTNYMERTYCLNNIEACKGDEACYTNFGIQAPYCRSFIQHYKSGGYATEIADKCKIYVDACKNPLVPNFDEISCLNSYSESFPECSAYLSQCAIYGGC